MTTLGEEIVAAAWEAFEAWIKEHDPDGELGVLEAISAYSKWCEEQSAFTQGMDKP